MTTFSLADYSIEQALYEVMKRVNIDIDTDVKHGAFPERIDRINKLKHSHRKLNAYLLCELDGIDVQIMKTLAPESIGVIDTHLLSIGEISDPEWETGVLSLRTIKNVVKLAIENMTFPFTNNKTRYFYGARIIKVGESLKLELRYNVKYYV